MFIKEIVKGEKTYYVLVTSEKKNDGVVWVNEFIKPNVAEALKSCGTAVKTYKR